MVVGGPARAGRTIKNMKHVVDPAAIYIVHESVNPDDGLALFGPVPSDVDLDDVLNSALADLLAADGDLWAALGLYIIEDHGAEVTVNPWQVWLDEQPSDTTTPNPQPHDG